jgi:hypothetical protein
MTIIFGIDTNKPVTSLLVRDAIQTCFYQAHCEDSQLQGDQEAARLYCIQIVKQGFEKMGADYENPTKDSLNKIVEFLVNYSQSFRNPEIIEGHKSKILTLINVLPQEM